MASPSPCCRRGAVSPQPVQGGVDLVDDRERVAGGDVDGLDQHPGHPVAHAAGGEALGVLDGPHAGLDADAGAEQRRA